MLCVIPGEVGEIWLDAHENIPIENRPVVLVKAPSIKEARQNARDFDDSLKSQNTDEHYNGQLALFMRIATGWRNYPLEFSRESVESCLTANALRELLRNVLIGNIVSVEEKKS